MVRKIVNLKGFGRTVTAITHDFESDEPDWYFKHPITGQEHERLSDISVGWSEQDPKEQKKWDKLVKTIKQKINDDPNFFRQWLYDAADSKKDLKITKAGILSLIKKRKNKIKRKPQRVKTKKQKRIKHKNVLF